MDKAFKLILDELKPFSSLKLWDDTIREAKEEGGAQINLPRRKYRCMMDCLGFAFYQLTDYQDVTQHLRE